MHRVSRISQKVPKNEIREERTFNTKTSQTTVREAKNLRGGWTRVYRRNE